MIEQVAVIKSGNRHQAGASITLLPNCESSGALKKSFVDNREKISSI